MLMTAEFSVNMNIKLTISTWSVGSHINSLLWDTVIQSQNKCYFTAFWRDRFYKPFLIILPLLFSCLSKHWGIHFFCSTCSHSASIPAVQSIHMYVCWVENSAEWELSQYSFRLILSSTRQGSEDIYFLIHQVLSLWSMFVNRHRFLSSLYIPWESCVWRLAGLLTDICLYLWIRSPGVFLDTYCQRFGLTSSFSYSCSQEITPCSTLPDNHTPCQ